jgi:hypothetical protein
LFGSAHRHLDLVTGPKSGVEPIQRVRAGLGEDRTQRLERFSGAPFGKRRDQCLLGRKILVESAFRRACGGE